MVNVLLFCLTCIYRMFASNEKISYVKLHSSYGAARGCFTLSYAPVHELSSIVYIRRLIGHKLHRDFLLISYEMFQVFLYCIAQ